MSTTTVHFGTGLFEFLAELNANNNREWFTANKQRYVTEVEEPMFRFIGDLGERLGAISASFVADPRRVGGSMYRIYRDTRFSKDKSPYKTWVAAHFPHESRGKDRSVPGFYLSLSPGQCVAGGGIYHPDPDSLRRIRDRIVEHGDEWAEVRASGLEIQGDSLKRAPAGYDPAHGFIEDIRRKDVYSLARFTDAEVCSPAFLDAYVLSCARVAPLMRFLTRALGVPW